MDFFFSSWNYIRTQFVRLVWCLCVLCIVCRCRRYQLPLFIIPSWWIMKTNEIAFNTVQLQPQISSAGMGKLDILTWVHSAHCTEYTPQTNGLCLMRCASHIKWPTSCTKTNNNIYSKQKKSKIHMRNDYDWRSDVHKSESTSIFLVILWTWSMKSHNYIINEWMNSRSAQCLSFSFSVNYFFFLLSCPSPHAAQCTPAVVDVVLIIFFFSSFFFSAVAVRSNRSTTIIVVNTAAANLCVCDVCVCVWFEVNNVRANTIELIVLRFGIEWIARPRSTITCSYRAVLSTINEWAKWCVSYYYLQLLRGFASELHQYKLTGSLTHTYRRYVSIIIIIMEYEWTRWCNARICDRIVWMTPFDIRWMVDTNAYM